MRNIKDILNKWWNVLGKRRSWFPYSFIRTADIGFFEFSGGTDWATITIYQNGIYYFSASSSANNIRSVLLTNVPIGTEFTLTDELAQGKVKYLKVGDTVIFDNR